MFSRIFLFLMSSLVVIFVASYALLSASLPQIRGDIALQGLSADVVVERDGLGVVSITGNTRLDLARATGFVHAQDRFFQMDLLRRKAAGELAALFGELAVTGDIAQRRHGFRALAREVLAKSTHASLIQAYTQGVNAGLAALDARPFEYLLLGQTPQPWQEEDSVLVIYAMYLELQGNDYQLDTLFAAMQKRLPPEWLSFLSPKGTSWDAALDDSFYESVTVPAIALQKNLTASAPTVTEFDAASWQAGSNAWLVGGELSAHGGAMLAGDMHLALGVPNIWYRLHLRWSQQQVSGLSLPGLPLVIAGSNGYVAWAFTNSYGDWMDLVALDALVADVLTSRREMIEVAGAKPQEVVYEQSPWGPVLDGDVAGQKYALRWMAHHVDATNLDLFEMEQVRHVEDAMLVAQRSGMPVQNILLADEQNNIAWTLAGRLPVRAKDVDTRFPITPDQLQDWPRWLPLEDYPFLVNPDHQRIWNGNARMVGGDEADKLGSGYYALGARATQIKDALFADEVFSEQDLLAIQLDDRAIFLERWWQLLVSVLDEDALRNNLERQAFKQFVDQWDGQASVSSVSYRLVRGFRIFLAQRLFGEMLQPMQSQDEALDYLRFLQYEGPLWQLVSEQPMHVLNGDHANWQALYLSVVDELIDYFSEQSLPLAQATWGQRNTLAMQHPLAMAVPMLAPLLNMPAQPLAGDAYMPRVQGPSFGASQRMVVSPGKEHLGVMHMPGGQSGHPLSPFYAVGHDEWVSGRGGSFLPGEAQYTLRLTAP